MFEIKGHALTMDRARLSFLVSSSGRALRSVRSRRPESNNLPKPASEPWGLELGRTFEGGALETTLATAERVVRRLTVASGHSFIREGDAESPNWPWRKVMKPLLSLITFVYLALIDLYLAALASPPCSSRRVSPTCISRFHF